MNDTDLPENSIEWYKEICANFCWNLAALFGTRAWTITMLFLLKYRIVEYTLCIVKHIPFDLNL